MEKMIHPNSCKNKEVYSLGNYLDVAKSILIPNNDNKVILGNDNYVYRIIVSKNYHKIKIRTHISHTSCIGIGIIDISTMIIMRYYLLHHSILDEDIIINYDSKEHFITVNGISSYHRIVFGTLCRYYISYKNEYEHLDNSYIEFIDQKRYQLFLIKIRALKLSNRCEINPESIVLNWLCSNVPLWAFMQVCFLLFDE